MNRIYYMSHRLVSYVLFISLFLQSCGGFKNQLIPQEKKQQSKTLELSNNPLISTDKEIVISGGYLASIYEEDGELKADLKADEIQSGPNYTGVLVVVEEGANLASLDNLDPTTQKNRIELNRSHSGQISHITIRKGGLSGGMMESQMTVNQEVKEKKEVVVRKEFIFSEKRTEGIVPNLNSQPGRPMGRQVAGIHQNPMDRVKPGLNHSEGSSQFGRPTSQFGQSKVKQVASLFSEVKAEEGSPILNRSRGVTQPIPIQPILKGEEEERPLPALPKHEEVTPTVSRQPGRPISKHGVETPQNPTVGFKPAKRHSERVPRSKNISEPGRLGEIKPSAQPISKLSHFKGASVMVGSKQNVQKTAQRFVNTSAPREIVLFCGNPGVGKSTLCNSIFQTNIFQSGVSIGRGMTQQKQEYIYENKKYIDTPGLSDIKLREQAAREIEKALKENNNYKIVFVAMLDSGRIRSQDLVTINTVCDAIKTDFEYGIIFNKVSIEVIQAIKESGDLDEYLSLLHKKPACTTIIGHEGSIYDKANIYLSSSSANREELINFISSLKANMILDKQVKTVDVRAFEENERIMQAMKEELERCREENEVLKSQQQQLEKDIAKWKEEKKQQDEERQIEEARKKARRANKRAQKVEEKARQEAREKKEKAERLQSAEEQCKRGSEFYNEGNYIQAKEWFEKAANQEYAVAQCWMGYLYYYGYGVRQEISMARWWWEKAAAQGNTIAQQSLVNTNAQISKLKERSETAQEQVNRGYQFYIKGDYVQAKEWYEKAANRGHAIAQNNMGELYYNAKGVTRDYKMAREWWEKSAAQENDAAQNWMGNLYYNGHGVTKNISTARWWWEKAAAQGNTVAQQSLINTQVQISSIQTETPEEQFKLGEEHHQKQDYVKAKELFEKAASRGSVPAKVYLSGYYLKGIVVPKNLDIAKQLVKPAAVQGKAYAQYAMGCIHHHEKNYFKARKWLQRAANQNYSAAKLQLQEVQAEISRTSKLGQGILGGMRGQTITDKSHLLHEEDWKRLKDIAENDKLPSQYREIAKKLTEMDAHLQKNNPKKAEELGNLNRQITANLYSAEHFLKENDPQKAAYYFKKARELFDQKAKKYAKLDAQLYSFQRPYKFQPEPGVRKIEVMKDLYERGMSFYRAKDYNKAIELLAQAAEQGDGSGYAPAQYQLATIYYEGGYGVSRDVTRARLWYEKAAVLGHAEAQVSLASAYYGGWDIPRDYCKVREWLEKAAAQGNTDALSGLANLYHRGLGVPQNPHKAIELYKQADALGDKSAQGNIAYIKSEAIKAESPQGLYERGMNFYRTKDYIKAIECFEQAADQRYAQAQYQLGWMYRHGVGTIKDPNLSKEWYELAAAQGHKEAQHDLKFVNYAIKRKERKEGEKGGGGECERRNAISPCLPIVGCYQPIQMHSPYLTQSHPANSTNNLQQSSNLLGNITNVETGLAGVINGFGQDVSSINNLFNLFNTFSAASD